MGVDASLGDDVVEVAGEFGRVVEGVMAVLVGQHRLEQGRELVARLADLVAVLDGDAEQIGDHEDWKRRREVRHEVELAALAGVIEQSAGDELDLMLPCGYARRCERFAHGAPLAGVCRRVVEDHCRREAVDHVGLVAVRWDRDG